MITNLQVAILHISTQAIKL